MGLNIKWNDDRVRGTTTAILLIVRDRLHRGETGNLVAAAMREFRADPKGYKERKAEWADAREIAPLTNPAQVAYYKNLLAAIDRLMLKMEQAKRHFNSLTELDNWLVATLERVT